MVTTMKTVTIAELKKRLSYYLRGVQKGESILVRSRDRVIARIDGVDAPLVGDEAEWLARLERRGIVRRGTGKLGREWIARRTVVGADVVEALLQERHSMSP
jgi:antitoxin (DNA-binding transcriptional repressor) of toxin-antitoxin stability system